MIILTGTGLNIYLSASAFLYFLICIYTWCQSVLATVSVFLRDMFYIYGIIIQILSYMTPIMYDINMLDPRLQIILKLNPLYHIITFARTIILYHQIPTTMDFAACIISSVASLIIGVVVFRKNQDKFIYYV